MSINEKFGAAVEFGHAPLYYVPGNDSVQSIGPK